MRTPWTELCTNHLLGFWSASLAVLFFFFLFCKGLLSSSAEPNLTFLKAFCLFLVSLCKRNRHMHMKAVATSKPVAVYHSLSSVSYSFKYKLT